MLREVLEGPMAVIYSTLVKRDRSAPITYHIRLICPRFCLKLSAIHSIPSDRSLVSSSIITY